MDSLQEKKGTIISVADLKAAFDRVWRGGLLRCIGVWASSQSSQMGEVLFTDRRAAVRWDDTEGSYMNLKEGVPQGIPVSPFLFCLSIAKLPKAFKGAVPNCRR